ncbi:hypothetical protein ACRW6E_23700, partial [Escherichia coli]
DDKGWDARKRAYCLKIQPATGSFARNLIYSTKPYLTSYNNKSIRKPEQYVQVFFFIYSPAQNV